MMAANWVPLLLVVDVTSMNLAALVCFGVPALMIVILTRGLLGYQRASVSS